LIKKGTDVTVLSQWGGNIRISTVFNFLPGQFGLIPFWAKATNYAVQVAGKYDVIWFHSPLITKLARIRDLKKAMFTFHTTYFGFYDAYRSHLISSTLPYYDFMAMLEYRMLKEISGGNVLITAVSPSVAQEISRNGSIQLPFIVPNGVSRKDKAAINRTDARVYLREICGLDFSINSKILFCLGRITEQKQPFRVLSLFELLQSCDPSIHLIVVGRGNLLKRLKKKAKYQPNAHILGYFPREQMPILFEAADAFLSLSCYEGLPLAALEAVTYNLPLILSNIPSHEWLLTSKIGHGILVNDYGYDKKRILDFLREAPGMESPRNLDLISKFGWSTITDQYLKLMEKIGY
jgi:glycosyltransferase involved in cell wall biosynthesis